MKQVKFMCRLLALLVTMVVFGNGDAFAHNTHYGKVTVSTSGKGTVYVGTSKTAASGKTSESWNCNRSSSGDTKTYYLFATPQDGYKFDGWYTNVDCTEGKQADNPYKLNVSATSTSSNSPTTTTMYAKFVEAIEFFSSTMTVSCVGESGSVAVSTTSSNEDFGAEKSASNLNDVETEHTYYLQAKPTDAEVYRFVGWYNDEACQTQLSKNANYTYKVTATSTDEAAPTQFHAYAKFEAIPYYCSRVFASAVGQGKVNVSLSNTPGEYQTSSNASQKIADKSAHTYYLNAVVDNNETEFDGWFADAECTNKLSEAPTYAYNVTSTSLDEAAPTSFNVYAKFSTRDMYQVRNAGFEKWAANDEPGFGWNSFPSAVGSQAGLGKGLSPNPSKVEGRNGGSAVRLYSKYAGLFGIGANANGNLTTGVVNMGSTTPTDAANHNFTDTEAAGHYLIIAGQPDAVEFYSKYKKGQSGDYKGHGQFIIHDKYNYRDPEVDEEQSHKIGSVGVNIEESTEWVRNYGEFTYEWEKDAAASTTKYLLINFTTNVTPGGSKDDELILDDVRLIYNSELATAKIGEDELVFTDGSANYDGVYDEDALELTSNGRAAIIETSYDAETAVLTIIVKGENISSEAGNYHTYTIQYASADPSKQSFSENLYVTVNNQTVGPQMTDVDVCVLNANYDFNFVLKNFALGEGDEAVPVGNIKVENLSLNLDGSFAFNGNITIEPGEDAEKMWIGPMLGEIPLMLNGHLVSDNHMLVNIDIDMSESLGQIINVHLGYDAAKLSINAAAKYGTFCAPFDVEVPVGVTAYTVDGAGSDGMLQMTRVNNIPAHTPVIVYGEFAENAELYQFGVATSGTPSGDYLQGVYTDTPAPVGSYVLQMHGEEVGFYLVESGTIPVVKANRCYLTSSAGVKAFFFGMEDEDGINAIESLTSGKAEIYNLNGQKLNSLQKGINIVNGKKIMVK